MLEAAFKPIIQINLLVADNSGKSLVQLLEGADKVSLSKVYIKLSPGFLSGGVSVFVALYKNKIL
jgi:hypothetical protein